MALEKEVKLKISHAEFIKALRDHGLTYSHSEPVVQEDAFYDTPDLSVLSCGEAFRIRDEDSRVVVCFKGRRQESERQLEKTREEVEGPLGSDEAMTALRRLGVSLHSPPKSKEELERILERSGFSHVLTVSKRREEIRIEGWKSLVHLDSVKGLGEFVEIQGEDCNELVELLELEYKSVGKTYAEMIASSTSRDERRYARFL